MAQVWTVDCDIKANANSCPAVGPSTICAAYTCPKCGKVNSGKASCCGNGGAWFEKCGDLGDDKFDHTWTEGLDACKGVDLGECDEIYFDECIRTRTQSDTNLSVCRTNGYSTCWM